MNLEYVAKTDVGKKREHNEDAFGILTEKNIYGTIGEVVGGTKPGRKTPSDITIYKSVGTTMPYVTINAMIYEKAIEMDLGRQVDKSSLDLIYSR